MNRFHVHVHVADLAANIRFYSQLFGAEPAVVKPDYAKWMLDDPGLNFAISNPRDGQVPGLAHLGLQAGSPDTLEQIGHRIKDAGALALAETGTSCCYANSDKYWAQDPQGLHWESFYTHGPATHYLGALASAPACQPDSREPRTKLETEQTLANTCCGPAQPNTRSERTTPGCCQ